MASYDEPDQGFGRSPENRQNDNERLRSVGDLINDAARLIELLLNTEHRADQIDYTLVFPIFPHTSALLPDVLAAKDPDYVTITAGKARIQQEGNQEGISTHLSIDITAGESVLKISRDSDDVDDSEEIDDVIYSTSPRDERGLSFVDKLLDESDEEFFQRLTPISKLPRREINTLLMSLAIPDNGDYSHFGDKNLLDLETFSFLIEALRVKALETEVQGTYLFQVNEVGYWGDAELTFNKKNGDDSFIITFTDSETDRTLIATANTKVGFDLKFFAYEDSVKIGLSPTTKEIVLLQRIIHNELQAIIEATEISSGGQIIEAGDPEKIATAIVEAEDKKSLERLGREIDQALGQDGFDSTDPSA